MNDFRPELHRGKIAREPRIESVRPLTREDLACLVEKRPVQVAQKLRDHHHRVARLVAAGLRMTEIVERSGVSYNRITQLKATPAFQELVAVYRGKVDEAFVREMDIMAETAISNMRKAEAMIADHLEIAEESGELLPLRVLETITSSRMDRFGYGKHNTQTNVNVDFAAQLEGAIARSGKATVIEATVNPPAPVAQSPRGPTPHVSPNPSALVPQKPVSTPAAGVIRRRA